MKVTVTFESDINEDGVDSVVSYSQSGVEDLSSLAWVLSEATRAGGFTYVATVKITTDRGHEFESPY